MVTWLRELGHEIVDIGPETPESTDYPLYAQRVVKEVVESNGFGILLCGSGIGVSMVANRYKNIRAALCRTPKEAMLSRQHNNANVLCLGARIQSFEELQQIVRSWIDSDFEGGRHQRRVDLFNSLGEDA